MVLGLAGLIEIKFPKNSGEIRDIFNQRLDLLKNLTRKRLNATDINYASTEPFGEITGASLTQSSEDTRTFTEFLDRFNASMASIEADYQEGRMTEVARKNAIKSAIKGTILDDQPTAFYSLQVEAYDQFRKTTLPHHLIVKQN